MSTKITPEIAKYQDDVIALETQIEGLQEALAWALDIIRINDERIKSLDPEGWAQLNHRADIAAKLKAFAALLRVP